MPPGDSGTGQNGGMGTGAGPARKDRDGMTTARGRSAGADRSSRGRRLAGMTLLIVGIVVLGYASSRNRGSDPGGAVPPTTTTTAPTTTAPTGSGWPVEAEFRPLVFGADLLNPLPVEDVGLHLWLDYDGWYLWSTGTNRERTLVFVEVDGEIPEASIRRVGAVTHRIPEPHRLMLLFEPGEPAVSGIRFNPGFFTSRIRVDTAAEGQTILLGTDEVPAALPLEIHKNRPLETD